ncbi:MAG: hypothetical protein FH760_12145 [Geosporobacter ferrireducens]|nr:hypothetical protein [Geosporobacter ferrireducens]
MKNLHTNSANGSKEKLKGLRRVARAIEKNDFWLKRLSFAPTKTDVMLLQHLRKQYRNLFHLENAQDRYMRKALLSMEVEDGNE